MKIKINDEMFHPDNSCEETVRNNLNGVWFCTRPMGHTGYHVALFDYEFTTENLCAIWDEKEILFNFA